MEETNKKEENEVKNETKEEVVSEEVSISSEEKALELAKKDPNRFVVVNANNSVEEVYEELIEKLKTKL